MSTRTLDSMSAEERSLLLYFETQAVDYGGTFDSRRMNADDFAIARLWDSEGFVKNGRIAFDDIFVGSARIASHWCVLSEDAWRLAHEERRARAMRCEARLKARRIGLDDAEREQERSAEK